MRNIQILGIPFDSGQPHPGVKAAYPYLIDAGLAKDLNTISPVELLGQINFSNTVQEFTDQQIKSSKTASNNCRQISDEVQNLKNDQDFLLTIGGDHGMALGTIHGVLAHNPETIIIWVDAHGDINTPETSPSGNFHGMPLSFLLNKASHQDFGWIQHFLRPEKLILIGPRDLDDGEKKIISDLSIQYFSSEDVNKIGAKEVLEMALHKADPFGISPLHLSFDVDVFDSRDFSCTGTMVSHGPQLEEIFIIGGLLGETSRLKSMDIVEFNPLLGSQDELEAAGELLIQFIKTTLHQSFISTEKMMEQTTLYSSPPINSIRVNY